MVHLMLLLPPIYSYLLSSGSMASQIRSFLIVVRSLYRSSGPLLFELLGADVSLTSGYHCQTNGQTERLNQVLEQYLRCYTSYRQNNWSHLLPLAEFSYNNSQHSATNLSPFFALR